MENEIELLSQDGKVVVSSRVVAQDFGKQHKHVLEAIKNLELQLNTVEFSALFILRRSRFSTSFLMRKIKSISILFID